MKAPSLLQTMMIATVLNVPDCITQLNLFLGTGTPAITRLEKDRRWKGRGDIVQVENQNLDSMKQKQKHQ